MKKLFVLSFVLFASFSSFSQATATWVKEKVDEKLSVKFPGKPIKETMGINYKGESDSTIFLANVMDLGLMGLDSATLAAMAPTEEFAEQFKGGITQQSPGSEVTKLDIGKWKDYTAYDIEVSDDNKKMNMTVKCIFIGSKMYMFMFGGKKNGSTINKEPFFSSIQLN